MPQTLLEVM